MGPPPPRGFITPLQDGWSLWWHWDCSLVKEPCWRSCDGHGGVSGEGPMMGRRESVIALMILLAAGVFFRSLSHGEDTPSHHSLATVPLHIGPWAGEVHTLDPHVLQILKMDDYLWRQYSGTPGLPLGLYIGYYQSMRQGATYHSPKNCLPGSGWYFVAT